jgi:hypothetical protein
MNHGYEYDVTIHAPNLIVRELTYVESSGARTQILRETLNTLDALTRNALVKLGWTPPMGQHTQALHDYWGARLSGASQAIYTAELVRLGWTPPATSAPPSKCLVKGCTNHSDQGTFIGNLCHPCHSMLTTGAVGLNGNTFVHSLRDRLLKIANIATYPTKE